MSAEGGASPRFINCRAIRCEPMRPGRQPLGTESHGGSGQQRDERLYGRLRQRYILLHTGVGQVDHIEVV